jgi:hypothetical protein
MLQSNQTNPRLVLLRKDVEQTILDPFRSHGWTAEITHEYDHHSSLELIASKGERTVHIAVLYSSATDNTHYKMLEKRVEHIFFHGQPYMLSSYAHGVQIPVDALADFHPLLITLNKQVEPDRSPPPRRTPELAVRRLMDEQPLEAILTRLQQFTSVNLAGKLVRRRADHESVTLSPQQIESKAAGIAYSMRNGLDYMTFSSADKLNKRILGLYYGSIAFAFAEMLASPMGPSGLDDVEDMTKLGHGLYAMTGDQGNFADLRVGVLATGFLPRWLEFLGQSTLDFPKKKPKSMADLQSVPQQMSCTLQALFSSMPEIDDIYAEVFGSAPGWIIPAYHQESNGMPSMWGTKKKADSTYALFIDRSGLITIDRLQTAGWPLAEIQPFEKDVDEEGNSFRARVDHSGHETWWHVLPTHSSPFGHRTTLLFPTMGGMCEYRTIAVTTLYALSILVRYMPSAWRRIEGGDEDHYLALVKASLAVWERVLPEQFLQSIAGENIIAAQPGSWLA